MRQLVCIGSRRLLVVYSLLYPQAQYGIACGVQGPVCGWKTPCHTVLRPVGLFALKMFSHGLHPDRVLVGAVQVGLPCSARTCMLVRRDAYLLPASWWRRARPALPLQRACQCRKGNKDCMQSPFHQAGNQCQIGACAGAVWRVSALCVFIVCCIPTRKPLCLCEDVCLRLPQRWHVCTWEYCTFKVCTGRGGGEGVGPRCHKAVQSARVTCAPAM